MSVYERHFKLHDEPFRLTPDPRYLFLSEKHREVLAHLRIGTSESGGFVCITGDVGTGKTTLIRSFLDQLEPGTPYAFIFNPPQSPLELLQTINAEFGLPSTQRSRKALVDSLNTFLLEQRRAGRRALVVVDEAQALSPEVLEELRLLSNLETTTAKLLQIVLFGQPQLADVLRSADLAQLNQRITLRWHLAALNARETVGYVRHRLRVAAGGIERPIFTNRALARIHDYSGGVPRLINILCHRALLAAYGAESPCVTARMVERVHDEIQSVPLLGNFRAARRWRGVAWATGGSALAAALAWVLIQTGASPLRFAPGPSGGDLPKHIPQQRASSSDEGTSREQRDAGRRLAEQGVAASREPPPVDLLNTGKHPSGKDTTRPRNTTDPGRSEARAYAALEDVGRSQRARESGAPDTVELVPLENLATSRDPDEPEWPEVREHVTIGDFIGSPDVVRPEWPDIRGRLAMMTADPATGAPPSLGLDRPATRGGGSNRAGETTHDRARRSAFEVARMLVARTEVASTTAAVDALLRRWHERPLEPYEMVVPMDLDAIAALRDLHHLSISGTVSMLRLLNLPAILELVMPGAAGPRYAVLSGVDADTCLLVIDGRVMTVERSFLDEYWLGQAHIVWRDFEGLSPTFAKGARGPRVRRLQQMLAQLTFYTGRITGVFDNETEMAVVSFQRSRRLFADAIVGRLTRIVLYDALGEYEHPRLTITDSSEDGADA